MDAILRQRTLDDKRLRVQYTKPPLSPQVLAQRLAQLDNQLHELLCGYHFYQQAMEALVAQDEPDFSDDFQYGLMLVGHWLRQQGPPLREQIQQLHQAARGE